jgi:hypothetical protein
LNDAITAIRQLAGVRTGVGVDVVAIIAGFGASEYHPITADVECAIVLAAVARLLIRIIAFFGAFFTSLKVLAHHAISAARNSAVAQTGVFIDGVGVIAGFIAGLTFTQV